MSAEKLAESESLKSMPAALGVLHPEVQFVSTLQLSIITYTYDVT